jgi:membrane protein DedA with SNARE-associated domain/rhodanese-related sulfurtransferase
VPLDYRILAVAINVLLAQLGLPVPATPALVIGGALAAVGSISAGGLFVGAMLACLAADVAWFLAGRVYGSSVMKMLCRISLTPDSCVSQTQERFERWGANALAVAKLVPGLSIVAPPLAGATGMGWARFLIFSTAGSAAWVGVSMLGGMLFRRQIQQLLPYLQEWSATVVAGVCGLLIGYIAYKWWERRRFYSTLRMARISVDELYALIGAGSAPVIVDVRTPTALQLEPRRIPGALHVPLHDVARYVGELPRDREIIAYCSCPNEASAAQVAKLLMNSGFKRVRPLYGGLEAWIAAGYAVEMANAAAQHSALLELPDEPRSGGNSLPV